MQWEPAAVRWGCVSKIDVQRNISDDALDKRPVRRVTTVPAMTDHCPLLTCANQERVVHGRLHSWCCLPNCNRWVQELRQAEMLQPTSMLELRRTVGPTITRPAYRAAATVDRYLLPAPDLSSKPAGCRCRCRSTGLTDGRTGTRRFMALTAHYADRVINIAVCSQLERCTRDWQVRLSALPNPSIAAVPAIDRSSIPDKSKTRRSTYSNNTAGAQVGGVGWLVNTR